MKLFLDANVLVAVLNKEYPLFDMAARVLSLSSRKNISLCTSPICLAIAFYFVEKKSGAKMARKKIKLITTHIQIAETTGKCVQQALNDPKVLDLEDGFEYYAAVGAKCSHLITEDVGDFHFSKIPVLTCRGILLQLV